MRQYLELMRHVRANGTYKDDRTGTGTYSVFGHQMRYPLADGFPLVTTKKVFLKGIIHELLWFLAGSTNIKYLLDHEVHIWDEWADEHGELGPVYGSQWRSWPGPDGSTIDQIEALVEGIRNNPDSRRHIVSAWNVAEVKQYGFATLSYAVSVLCGRWQVVLPVVSTQRRYFPWCAFQHCLLCIVNHDDCSGL